MEIELSNGQLKFWQWDTKQRVKVPENVPTVHFKFGASAVELPVTDRWAKVPDELLQTGKDILLWTYKEDHTLDTARIPVERRPKPDGYAYTPTEIKTWEQLDERIKALEAANVQANWDQNDASAADYVRGRTHYVGTKHDVRVIKQTSGKFSPELGLIVGNTYRVDYDRGSGFGVGEEFVCKDLNEGKDGIEPAPYVGHANGNGNPDPYLIFDNSIDLLPAFDHMVNIKGWKIEGDFADIKTLATKYIDPKLLERIKALEDGGGVAGVSSVNGQTGAVEITAKGLGALTEDDLQSATDKALAQAKASGEFDGAPGPKGDTGATGPQGPAGAGLDVTGATVGQTVKISAVDSNGVPTAWVPVDMASGGGEWNTIVDTTLTESAAYNQEVQLAGYHEVVVCFRLPKVDSVIQLGYSYSPVGQAGLYYGKIGATTYPWVYRSHAWCDADGNIIDSIIVTGAEGGIGVYLNIMTQATSQKKIYNRMKLDKELPAGTQIWIKAR